MDLGLKNKVIAVGGASGGLGRAVAEKLIGEEATVIGIARSRDKLKELSTTYGDRFIPYTADLSNSSHVTALGEYLAEQDLYGCVLNSGGPPPGQIADLTIKQWDAAYASTLRWKIQLVTALLPALRAQGQSRLLFIESVSIKQPINNLVLSNAFRAAVAGFVKTLSREEGGSGIGANILAPGYHATDRITTVLEQAAKLQEVSVDEVRKEFLREVPLGVLGDPADFADVASFLLSPLAHYITGQTISADGGMTRFLTG